MKLSIRRFDFEIRLRPKTDEQTTETEERLPLAPFFRDNESGKELDSKAGAGDPKVEKILPFRLKSLKVPSGFAQFEVINADEFGRLCTSYCLQPFALQGGTLIALDCVSKVLFHCATKSAGGL